ncbi:cellulose synthase-like protein G3 [Tanacetum coccineum]
MLWQVMYENMKSRIETVVQSGDVSLDEIAESDFRDAFKKWTPDFTRRQHPTVIEILLDNCVDKDVDGVVMPNLIYISREKSNDKPHNFKAGALNVMIRASGLMTNGQLVLVLDCDMYSNDPKTPLRALCYFMDPNADPKLAFVQFPQRFSCINKNDIYASEFMPETQILSLGMDGLLGALFMGTGGFFKRHVIGDEPSFGFNTFSNGIHSKSITSRDVLVSAHEAASCNYEDNTNWGRQIGFRYGTLTEDTYTSFRLHCEGWKSVLCNPKRAAFLGGSPSNLNDILTQIKRWYTGFLEIFFNKYCPLTYGVRSMNPLQALCYTHYTLRSFWSIPVIVYAFLPQVSLINSISIFPKVSEDGFLLHALLFLGAYGKDFLDFVVFGGRTTQRWWSHQRMWLMWGLSSYPFALLEWSLKSLGLSTSGFNVTSKVVDEEQNRLYEQGVFEFGVESVLFFPISVASLINLLSFLKGVAIEFILNGRLEELFVQIFISGFVVVNSWPIYEGMILRKDKGKMPLKISLASLATTIAIGSLGICGTDTIPVARMDSLLVLMSILGSLFENDVYDAVKYFFTPYEYITKEDKNETILLLRKVDFEKAYDSGLLVKDLILSKSNNFGGYVENTARVKGATSKLGCLILKTPFTYLGLKVGGSMSWVYAWNYGCQ